MAAINDTTRKMITTAIKVNTPEYRDGWDRIFGRKVELPTAANREQARQARGCSCPACELVRENIEHWRKISGK